MKVIQPKYIIPDIRKIKNRYLDPTYIAYKSKIKQLILKNMLSLNVTTDYWTSGVQNNSYIKFTLHFIYDLQFK